MPVSIKGQAPTSLWLRDLDSLNGRPVDLPAEIFENFLAQAITVARRSAGMVTGTVTLDAWQKCSCLGGMFHTEVDEKPRDTHWGTTW